MWFITLLLGAAVIFLIKYWLNSYLNDWKKRGIPYSPSSSPFKMMFQYIFTKKGLLEIMVEEYNELEPHKFAGFFQMFAPGIMIRDPDLFYQICIKDFSHFVDRNLPTDISDLFTDSVSSLTGDKWRTLRHKMTPTFTSGKLKFMFNPINECCNEMVVFIDKKLGHDIEIRDVMFKYSINIIGNVSFGLKVDALNEETEQENEFLQISRTFFKPSFMLMVKFMLSITAPKVRKYIKFSLVDKPVDTFFRKLVNDMIEHRERTGEIRNDFLQLMLEQKKKEDVDMHSDFTITSKKTTNLIHNHAEEPEDHELLEQLNNMQDGNDNYKTTKVFTIDSIVAQTFTFISAGSETIAAALSFTFYELAVNPECQKKLQIEIDEVIAKHGFTYNAIKEMKYMEQVFNESTRLHTIATFITRFCTKDYKIPDSDVVIEKGTFIGFPTIGVNLNPQYFPDPYKFDPDRFEDMDSIHPGLQVSFGIGPRMCIAKRLAILEVKMVLAAVLQRFTVIESPKTKLPLKIKKSSVFQHVDGGLWVKFQKR